jgi:hypothetical protein
VGVLLHAGDFDEVARLDPDADLLAHLTGCGLGEGLAGLGQTARQEEDLHPVRPHPEDGVATPVDPGGGDDQWPVHDLMIAGSGRRCRSRWGVSTAGGAT